jgi:hypothetical protein
MAVEDVEFQSTQLATPPSGTKVAVDLIGGQAHQFIKVEFGVDGVATPVDGSNPLPVTGTVATGGLTNAELRASPVPVSGTVSVTGVATAANQATEIAALASILSAVDGIEALLAPPLSVTGTVAIAGSVAVTGPLTDTQLRATPVPVSGTVSTGGLTNTELRASAVPVSLTSTTITGTVAVSATALPLPAGAATSALQGGGLPAALGAGGGLKIDGSGTALPVSGTVSVTGVATAANQASEIVLLAGGLPASLGQKAMAASLAVVVASDQSAIPVSGTITVTGVATAANQTTQITAANSTNTLLAGGLPAALATGGGLKTDMTTIVGTAPSVSSGNKDAGTLRVTLATDQVALTNALLVTAAGNVASGATDSGNPVKVGGKYNSTLPTFTDGQRGDLQVGTRGSVSVQVKVPDSTSNVLTDSAGNWGVAVRGNNSGIGAYGNNSSDGSTGANVLNVDPLLMNSAGSWDRQRNTLDGTLLASSARTATTNSPDQTNYNGRGVSVVLNVTANPGGIETLSLKIQGKDSISGNYYDIADATVLFTAGNGTKVLTVYPGVLAADFVAGDTGKSAVVPRTWRAVVTHSSTGSWTYSLSGVTIL